MSTFLQKLDNFYTHNVPEYHGTLYFSMHAVRDCILVRAIYIKSKFEGVMDQEAVNYFYTLLINNPGKSHSYKFWPGLGHNMAIDILEKYISEETKFINL